ncbi:hypothetical protein Y032_0507g2696 [Ancylostoma ceylanicum]|uniref:Fibronectin type-III domain-containing protein n=1 Tax=Ancylostoma ceylanicum TaxID=53326 RepID=A0A016WT91_9BILA|nr:hypothetical protein Y032_0507g2696 [Ancylostoma ceylanicum]
MTSLAAELSRKPFLLPNRVQPPFLQFRIVHEADFKLYLEWERICEEPILKYYLVRYRTIEHKVQWKEFDVSRNSTYTEIPIFHETEYIIQLKGIGEHRNYTGSQLFYKTKPRSGHGTLFIHLEWYAQKF